MKWPVLRKKYTNDRFRVAIATDALVSFGGADRVLKSLLDLFPDANVYTAVYDKKGYPWLDGHEVSTTFIQRVPCKAFWKRRYSTLAPLAFEQFRFDKYDLVISLSAGAAKGVITQDTVPHIGIVLTPPRYQWSGRGGDPSIKRRRLSFHALSDIYLRVWDQEASFRPDILVAISKEVQNRIKKVYKRDSKVVYPGVDLGFWRLPEKNDRSDKKGHYIIVSRLYKHKRIDVAVRACNSVGRELVVIGIGPEERRLKRIAGDTVSFTGFVEDEEVRSHLWGARGFLFPGIEDFGLAPVEAMACGVPVIAYDKGGVPETVTDGKNGVLYDGGGSVENLVEAIKRFENMRWSATSVSGSVAAFSETSFKDNFMKVVDEVREEFA
jgi:glycosyltransferase involved in cell wall biosynthesis